jgi:hypothetical protein
MAKKQKQKEQVLREIKLTDATKVVISSFLIKGDDDGDTLYINVRKFYKKKSDNEWKPDKQGIVLPHAKSKRVIKAMIETYQNAKEEAVPLPPKEDKPKGKKGNTYKMDGSGRKVPIDNEDDE